MSEAVIFDQKFVDKWMPLIHKEIKAQVFGYTSSDVCYEWDDLKQECLINIWKAVSTYNPDRHLEAGTRPMTMDNYIIMVVQSRLGNFRNKISKNNFKTSNFTEMNGWGMMGCEVQNTEERGSNTVSSKMKGHVAYDQQDIMNEMLDAKTVMSRLQTERKKIYEDYFILGKSIREICEDLPHLKYYQITRILNNLKKIHSTLVEGQYAN